MKFFSNWDALLNFHQYNQHRTTLYLWKKQVSEFRYLNIFESMEEKFKIDVEKIKGFGTLHASL